MPYHYVSINDIPFLDVREVIISEDGSTVIINFAHYRLERKLIFTMYLKLYFTDRNKIYTDVKVEESKDIVVSNAVKLELQKQLNSIFASHFISLTGGQKI